MMKLAFGSALALAIAAPASAQLLGGAGEGSLGGTLGGLSGIGAGQSTGALGGTLGLPRAGTSTAATNESASARRSVDTRSGRVSASGSGSGAASGSGPRGSVAGSGSASGGVDAQLIGTSAVSGVARGAVGATRSMASDAVGTARATGATAVGAAREAAPTAPSGSAMGAGSLSLGQLALAGAGQGSVDVTRGMSVADSAGRTIGTVQAVRTAATGAIQTVTVAVGRRLATLPAANFSGSGNVLVSAMSKGQVQDTAKDQASAE